MYRVCQDDKTNVDLDNDACYLCDNTVEALYRCYKCYRKICSDHSFVYDDDRYCDKTRYAFLVMKSYGTHEEVVSVHLTPHSAKMEREMLLKGNQHIRYYVTKSPLKE
jgi:hypothetical protein